MKSKPIAIAAAFLFLGSTLQAEEAEIIYRASGKKNAYAAAASAADALEAGEYRAVVRAQHDANIYRHEGRASARHDEISSHGLFVHLSLENPGVIHAGHSLAR